MDISLRWLNQYLTPGDVTAEQVDHIMTQAGMPIEEHKPGLNGDTILDVEVTSNRADCLGHIGIAREIAAAQYADKPRVLTMPVIEQPPLGPPIADQLTLDNRVPDRCPLFTARLIRNVKVGPSPDWLREAIENMGHRPINNVVDVTNYITLELGNPCHVFDYDKLAGGTLIVRQAEPGEKIKTLYAGEHELRSSDLVVADRDRPQSLAGIIGGHDSQVDSATTTVVFEMATWDTLSVRNTGRRLQIRTDAAFRFERGIDARTIDFAAQRAAALICQASAGQLAEGVRSQGAPLPKDKAIALRPDRCDQMLGIHTEPTQMADLLNALSFKTTIEDDGHLRCIIPPHRSHDVTREIDLIEEVARARSLAVIPVQETLPVRTREPQTSERAMSTIARTLTGLGFFETITFSFTAPAKGELFRREGTDLISVDDERRKAEPTLRPSVLLGLLATRHANQSARVSTPGGVRLYELAQTFAQKAGTRQTDEYRTLAMLIDVPFEGKKPKHDDLQAALRIMRGSIDAIAKSVFGPTVRTIIEPTAPQHQGYEPDAYGAISVECDGINTPIGGYGLISDAARNAHDLDHPLVGAELKIQPLIDAYPPRSDAQMLPQFPGIDRDLSLIVPEQTPWSRVEELISGLKLDLCVGWEMVDIFRGKQLGDDKKSVTLRLHFRDDERTLRHEEVDPQVELCASHAKSELQAQIRTGS